MTLTAPSPDAAKRPRRARAIGRPNEAVGRDTVLDRVCELIRTVAPADVTLVAAAKHADVHVSLLKYYFRDRSSLLAAAAERMMLQVQGAMDVAVTLPEVGPEQLLRTRVRALLTLQTEHPNFHRLILNEIITSDRPEAKALVDAMTKKGVAFYAEIVAQGVRQGVMRPVDPLMLYFSVIGLTEIFVSAGGVLRQALGDSMSPEAIRERYLDYITDMVLKSLRPEPA